MAINWYNYWYNLEKYFVKYSQGYTGSLAPTDFSGAFFTHAHFQKIAQITSLCHFHYISEGNPSIMHFGY